MFTIKRAIGFFADKKVWDKLTVRAMEQDYSWDESAKKYEELYNKLLNK